MPFLAQLIYSGLVGEQSSALIEYLEAVPSVQPIRAGENPATWMLEVTGGASVTGKSKAAKVDFVEYYEVSHQYWQNLPAGACIERVDRDTLLSWAL